MIKFQGITTNNKLEVKDIHNLTKKPTPISAGLRLNYSKVIGTKTWNTNGTKTWNTNSMK
jgi:hypothetical protein